MLLMCKLKSTPKVSRQVSLPPHQTPQQQLTHCIKAFETEKTNVWRRQTIWLAGVYLTLFYASPQTEISPISTLCGATLATAGDPGSPLALLSLSAALAAIPRHGLLVSRVVLRRLPVSALISELKGMGTLISFLDAWRSGVVLPSPSVWMSFSLADFFCRRLLISMILPMISTGPVMVFLRGEKSSFTFFKYEAGAQPSLPKYLRVDYRKTKWLIPSSIMFLSTLNASLKGGKLDKCNWFERGILITIGSGLNKTR